MWRSFLSLYVFSLSVVLSSDVIKHFISVPAAPIIPYGYHAQIIHGFVEELVVNDDPEYQWIDKIRTPRASNEARQVVFLKLSAEVMETNVRVHDRS